MKIPAEYRLSNQLLAKVEQLDSGKYLVVMIETLISQTSIIVKEKENKKFDTIWEVKEYLLGNADEEYKRQFMD